MRGADVEHHPDAPAARSAASAAILPGCARRQLQNQESVASRRPAAPSTGWPSSLLNDPGGATTSPSGVEHRGQQVFGRCLPRRAGDPDDRSARRPPARRPPPRPAWPARPAPPRRSRRRRARAPACAAEPALRGLRSGPRRWRAPRPAGPPAPRPRPAATADAAWSCPSVRAPGSARNSPPGSTVRESNSTVPVTWQLRGGLRRDVGQCAADDRRRSAGATVMSRSCAAPRRARSSGRQLHPVVERVGLARRSPARSRGLCRRSAPRRRGPPRATACRRWPPRRSPISTTLRARRASAAPARISRADRRRDPRCAGCRR